jgi:hypothetical protein
MSNFEELLQTKPKTNTDYKKRVQMKKRAIKHKQSKLEKLKKERKPLLVKETFEKVLTKPMLEGKSEGKSEGKTEEGYSKKIYNLEETVIKQSQIINRVNEGFDRESFLAKFNKKIQLSPTKPSEKVSVFRILQKMPNKILLISKITSKPSLSKPTKSLQEPADETDMEIGDFKERLPQKPSSIKIPASKFYLNNREKFINFTNTFYTQYKKKISGNTNITCAEIAASKKNGEFRLLRSQKIVRDYINLKTPYRGLLLYHGLGAGKTCGSVSIAEGIKTSKQVIVMAPASLIPNYKGELKFCGDQIYKLKQFWEFITVDKNSPLEEKLSKTLNINVVFIRKQKGVWLVNVTKKSNFNDLDSNQKLSLNKQIDKMVDHKYKFIGYNGYRMDRLKQDSDNFTINPFSNKVVIVDEAHNLVSRIVNKIKKPDSLSYKLYDYLMSADNCKIVLLTGTPIINYPNEIGILFNILRGYIKTFEIKLTIRTTKKIQTNTLMDMLKTLKLVDYIDYNSNHKTLIITRNPFGFVSNYENGIYKGVELDEAGNISDSDFVDVINTTLSKHQITFQKQTDVVVKNNTALPDTLDEFNFLFKNDDNTVKNPELFKKRILGLTSYFRSAQESLMPAFSNEKNIHVLKIPMSDLQLGIYQNVRDTERTSSKNNAKKRKKAIGTGLYEQTTSTYRIFSRSSCNFVFPDEIVRPMPNKKSSKISSDVLDENDIDGISIDERRLNIVEELNEEELVEKMDNIDKSYNQRQQYALDELKARQDEFLHVSKLQNSSPKFLELYNNIVAEDKKGLHLVYSQFKTLEGIGIFKLVLEANGFAEFKIKKVSGVYKLDILPGDMGKPMFASYTGNETVEEKEILRWIFNSEWDKIPLNIKEDLEIIGNNNNYGEIIKVFMITSSGAEGITLKNTRFVHIMEPYWHPVRVEQVIGRARRICSHDALEKEDQTVDVFIYLMTFSKEQLASDNKISGETRKGDVSKMDNKTIMTTDEFLWEISQRKEAINKNILFEVKESSMDCNIHNDADNQEQLKCFSFGKTDTNTFSFNPDIKNESKDDVDKINKRNVIWRGKRATLNHRTYVLKQELVDKKWKLVKSINDRYELYDFDSYKYVQKHGIGIVEFIGYTDGKKIFDDP